MANDRIYLRCKTCGEKRVLFKYWGAGGEMVHDVEAVGDWMGDHLMDCAKPDTVALWGDPGFMLETESKAEDRLPPTPPPEPLMAVWEVEYRPPFEVPK